MFCGGYVLISGRALCRSCGSQRYVDGVFLWCRFFFVDMCLFSMRGFLVDYMVTRNVYVFLWSRMCFVMV